MMKCCIQSSSFYYSCVLTILIARGKEYRGWGWGVSILQYTDDAIIFTEHDLEKAVNMKLILFIFEQRYGLKINFHKS